MKVVAKKPGQLAEIIKIENELQALQEYVGGWIETVTFATDACIICNDEGRLLDMPYNFTFCGVDFYGPILIVGVKNEDFTDCPAAGFILTQINRGQRQ